MKKNIIIMTLIITITVISNFVNAQMLRLVTKNANGTYEYLHFNRTNDTFQYSTSSNPSKINLKTVKVTKVNIGKNYQVQFPNSNKIYELKTNGATLLCTNPDGTKQEFAPIDRYYSRNTNGTVEYIEVGGPPPVFFYLTSKNSKKINLKSVGGDMMTNTYKVSFPNDSKVYILKFKDNDILCTNPDGTKQIFTKEYK